MAPREGVAPQERTAQREEGVAPREGTATPPHEKKTLATKQNVKFIYFNCHLLLYLPGGSVS